MPAFAFDPNPWIAGMITILTISAPFAVFAGLLLQRFQEAHGRSEDLVDELRVTSTPS